MLDGVLVLSHQVFVLNLSYSCYFYRFHGLLWLIFLHLHPFDYLGRIAHRNRVRGYILYDDTTSSDGDVIADCYPGKDGGTTANPAIVTDGDRFGPLLA